MDEVVVVGRESLRRALEPVGAQVAEQAHVLTIAGLRAVLALEADGLGVGAHLVGCLVQRLLDFAGGGGDGIAEGVPEVGSTFLDGRGIVVAVRGLNDGFGFSFGHGFFFFPFLIFSL